MTDLSFSLPSELARRIESRIAEGAYADTGAYLRDLIRRDLDAAADVAWVRARVQEGLESGFIERDAREVLKEIAAERQVRRG